MSVDKITENYKVSIITVSYNSSNTIEKTIRSVLTQTYHDIEYLIIDGGSTDETHQVIQNNADKRMHLVVEEDEGIYDAMNKGFLLATGDIIYYLNCGDYLADNTILENVCAVFQSKKDVEIVYGDAIQYGEREELLQMRRDTPFHVMTRCGINHQALFAKRNAFCHERPFNTHYKIYADYDWLLNGLCNHNLRLKYLCMPVVYYQAGGASQQEVARYFPERLHIIKEYFTKAFNLSLLRSNPFECLYFAIVYIYLVWGSVSFNISFRKNRTNSIRSQTN